MTMKSLIIVPTLTAPVSLSPDAAQRKLEVLKLASAVKRVTTPPELELAVGRMRDIKRLLKEVEDTRKAVKEPIRAMGSKVDELAQNFSQQLNDEMDRINPMVTGYQEAEQRRVREEEQRQEAARQEAAKKAADAERERERLAGLSRPSPAKEIAAEQKVEETQVALQQAVAVAPMKAARASGLVVKTVIEFEITDAAALYAVRPEWFTLEPKRAIIKASVTKATKLPGITVTERLDTNVRG